MNSAAAEPGGVSHSEVRGWIAGEATPGPQPAHATSRCNIRVNEALVGASLGEQILNR